MRQPSKVSRTDQIVKLAESKLSVSRIADKLAVHPNTVRYHLKKRGELDRMRSRLVGGRPRTRSSPWHNILLCGMCREHDGLLEALRQDRQRYRCRECGLSITKKKLIRIAPLLSRKRTIAEALVYPDRVEFEFWSSKERLVVLLAEDQDSPSKKR